MRFTKFAASALLAAVVLASAVSCGETAGAPSASAETNAAVTDAETTAEEIEEDPFQGLEQQDFGGQSFTVLTREMQEQQLYVEQETGDVLNDAVRSRNRMVEDRYNVVIRSVPRGGEWADRATIKAFIISSVSAGDAAFDLIQGYAAILGDSFGSGVYLNLNDISQLRLDSAWWSPIVRDALTVNGKLFVMTGDIAYDMWENMHVIYFNKVMQDSLGMSSPYAAVLDGTWTYDRYLSMLTGVYADLNGNGKTDDEDRFGVVVYDQLSLDNFHNAFGFSYTLRDEDGGVTLNVYNEKTVALHQKMYELINGPDIRYTDGDVETTRDDALKIFMEGRSMIMHTSLRYASRMRSMDNDFGILPYPKENEAQDMYYTTSRDGRSMIAVPTDAPDPEFSGLITEALCTVSKSEVTPVYLEKVLKGKTARDEESAEMLDIIRAGFTLDFAAEYAPQTENAGFLLRTNLRNEDLGAAYASVQTKIETAFNKFLEAYAD